MTKPLQRLYLAQFLTAFSDNVIFFVLIGILQLRGLDTESVSFSLDIFQAMFFLSYVLFAPVVGAFADRNPKSMVLLFGNIFKATGILLMMSGVSPGIGYFMIGLGAVVYSPAKYGLLSQLTNRPDELLKANGRLEGYTILAILIGSGVGGQMAQWLAPTWNLVICLLFYMLSLIWGLKIPKFSGNPTIRYRVSIIHFFSDFATLMRHPHTRFGLIGGSAFWMVSAVTRLGMIVWLAEQLSIKSTSIQSAVVASTAVGIVIGTFIVPKMIQMDTFYRSAFAGLALSIVLCLAVFSPSLWVIVLGLLLIGAFGGMFIIPMNARLQQDGSELIGAGKVIAIQNFIENIVMILGIGLFMYLKSMFSIQLTLILIAFILLLTVFYLFSLFPTVRQSRLNAQHSME